MVNRAPKPRLTLARRLLGCRPLAAILSALVIAVTITGCVSMPDGGPVRSYAITQSPGANSQRYLQFVPQPPADGWDPAQIVQGFLAASASLGNGQQVARDYLTPGASGKWHPSWSAVVFSANGPHVSSPVYSARGQRGKDTEASKAKVTVTGTLRAELSSYGDYAVPSASGSQDQAPITFTLVKSGSGGQWRISSVPPSQLLLTSVEFSADYQLRNLYFIDPTGRFLVPDPVYVPLQATSTDLMSGLVKDLIHQPEDWLAGGARTAFPAGTRLLGDVAVAGGLATVDLGGAFAKARNPTKEDVSAQLFATLAGSAQGQLSVRSIALYVNGKPWFPPTSPDNVVQNSSPLPVPSGADSEFYYLDANGNLWRRQGTTGAPVKVRNIGTGYSAIAVSPGGRHLAALRDGMLFTGAMGGPLIKRQGTGYSSMSWDSSGDVWAVMAGSLFVLRGNVTPQDARSAHAAPIAVDVQRSGVSVTAPVTAVKVAPDGVRVALIIAGGNGTGGGGGGGGTTLDFGAITAPSPDQGRGAQLTVMQVTLSPFYVSSDSVNFSAVTWYGPDNVITLGSVPGAQGPVLTEYSVNGESSSPVSSDADIMSITASMGSELVAEAKGGVLLADASTSGAWAIVGDGLAPAYPG